MNELITSNQALPDNLPDLSRFVLIGREKLNAVRAEIRAIEKVGLAQEVHQQKLQEAQEIAEAVLDAEVQIGKLTAEIPKASGGDRKSKDFKIRNDAEFEKSKSEALKQAGIKQDTAERFERLAKYPEAVKKAKEEARQEGRVVTRQDALDEIHDMVCGKNKSPQQRQKEFIESIRQEREDFKEKKENGVVSFADIKKDKENAEILANNFCLRCLRTGNDINGIWIQIQAGEIDLRQELKAMPAEDIREIKSHFEHIRSILLNLLTEVDDAKA
jgi:hypothetical protein